MTGGESGIRVFDAATVRRELTPDVAIAQVRAAMIALSAGEVRQVLRSFIGLGEGRTFAIMPAALSGQGWFGAKLVSVFAGEGGKAHRGVVVLFDGPTGAPVCVADAETVTEIRTAAASAVATEQLALPDADRMTVLGLGRQAASHMEAIRRVRPLREVVVWGRDLQKARTFAARMTQALGLPVRAEAEAERAVAGAQIVCTVTAAADPILQGGWLDTGTHVNLVGSSGPGQAEADVSLVAGSRFVVDHREHVLAHGGEFLRAMAAGAVDEGHIAAEIGQVLAGEVPGRTSPGEITVYKSLGHAAQDIAVTAWLHERAGAGPDFQFAKVHGEYQG